MSDALTELGRHVNRVLAADLHPLYLVVDEAFRLLEYRGRGDRYGLPVLQEGMLLAHELPILATADPDDPEPQSWRFVALSNVAVCHLHVLRLPDAWGVAMLDASAEHAAQQARQQVAHELLLLRDERERLIRDLDAANRLKSEFIARMSHEFRTPLASVIGYSDTLREERPDDSLVQYHLDAVGRGARYLLNLVENLLDQARVEDDRLVLNPGVCDLHELVDDLEKLLRPVAEHKKLALAWTFTGGVPTRVWVDAVRLKQVVTNLVGNAIKFTAQGGVDVEFAWQDGRLRVSVTDSGPGISDEDATVIFELFRQGRHGQGVRGAGLGLSISRSLVQAMGGAIRLEASDGGGSRFAFDVDAVAVRRGGGGAGTLAGRCVVVADDDSDLLDLFGIYLAAAGCEVRTAHDAETTRTAVRRFAPDAVMLDLSLGRKSGASVAETLRADGFRNRIVLLTATQPGDRDDATLPPAIDARWGKPINRRELINGLAGLIG